MTYPIAEFRDTILTDEQGVDYRVPAEFKRLVAECLSPIIEADQTGELGGVAYLYQRLEQFEEALTEIECVRDALNELTTDSERQHQIMNLFYCDLPAWARNREKLEAKFKCRIDDPELMVSRGYVRGHMDFVREEHARRYS